MLTARQRAALLFIEQWITRTGGVAPTYDEIRVGLGYAHKSAVHYLLRRLSDRGHITLSRRVRSTTVIRPITVGYFVFDDRAKRLVPWRQEARKIKP